jgi:hypothetical protein
MHVVRAAKAGKAWPPLAECGIVNGRSLESGDVRFEVPREDDLAPGESPPKDAWVAPTRSAAADCSVEQTADDSAPPIGSFPDGRWVRVGSADGRWGAPTVVRCELAAPLVGSFLNGWSLDDCSVSLTRSVAAGCSVVQTADDSAPPIGSFPDERWARVGSADGRWGAPMVVPYELAAPLAGSFLNGWSLDDWSVALARSSPDDCLRMAGCRQVDLVALSSRRGVPPLERSMGGFPAGSTVGLEPDSWP